MKMRDRMTLSDPIVSKLVDRVDALITRENLIRAAVASGLFALAGDIATKYEAHRVLTSGTVHAGADSTNTLVGTTTPTTKATLVTMLNDIRTKFAAHIIRTSTCHGAADTANTPATIVATESMEYEALQSIANALRVNYEAHRILTAGTVHGLADSTNAMAVAANATAFVQSLDQEV